MQEKIYTTSKGEKINVRDMNTEHILNGMSKAYRDSFATATKKDFFAQIDKAQMLKEELHRRLNDFSDTLSEDGANGKESL